MRLFERFKFYYKMLLLNRKNTLIMFLGLGISLAMISEGLIFMFSFQYNSFVDFNNGIPPEQYTISLDSFYVTDKEDTIMSELENITIDAIEEAGLSDEIERIDWFIERGGMLYLKPDNEERDDMLIPDFNMFGVPVDYYSGFESILYNGTLPYKSNEVLVVAERNIIDSTNLSKLGMFPLYVPVFINVPPSIWDSVDAGIPYAGNYINVTGVIAKEDFENYKGNLEEDFDALDEYLTDQFIITRPQTVMEFINSIGYFPDLAAFTCRISFDLSKIDAFNINGEIKSLQTLGQELVRSFEKNNYAAQVRPNLITLLQNFNEEFLIFQLFGLLFITPIIGMALSLTNYSTNLMKNRQKRQVSNMLQRGSSRKEVITLLILQVVEFTVMAVLVCVIIGYPFASLMIRSSGFLAFSGVSIFPAINMIIFYTIIGSAFVFSVAINAKNIWDMSNISTTEAYGTTIQKKPVWEKTFADVILILVGIALWLVVRLQLKGASAYTFAYGFGTTAPVCLILGSILFITRIYPYFVRLLSKIGWKRPKLGILGLSAKRSLRRKSSVIRSLVLVSLTFTLIISSLTIITSYEGYDSEQAYYQLGSDILIKDVKVDDDTIKNQVEAIDGVQLGSYIKYSNQLTNYGSVVYSYIIVGIDPEEFPIVGYFENDYLNSKPSEFFSKIVDENDVVVQKDQMEKINSYTGDTLKVTADIYGVGDTNYTLDVVGVYNYFPRFFMDYPSTDSAVYRFSVVGNYDFVENLSYSQFSVAGDLLVKVKDGYSISEVANQIETTLNRDVEHVNELKTVKEGSLRNTMLYGSLNTAFISSMFITIAALSLMIVIQSIENEMEVIMLKTLGMSPKQLFSLFTTEALTVVLFGSILGLGVGIFSAKMFMEILTIDSVIPPSELVIPPLQIFLAFILLFVVAVGAAAVTAGIIFRKDTIKGIKQV